MLERFLCSETILERVDAYSIYSFYIEEELEVGRAYSSPLRVDDSIPSFAMFFYEGVLLFKDHALGVSGTAFTFVKLLFDYKTLRQAYSRISIDFELDLFGVDDTVNGTPKKVGVIAKSMKVKPKLISITIASNKRVSKEYLGYWFDNYGITLPTLKYYNATEPNAIHYKYEESTLSIYPKELTIAYRIYKEYKIYSPGAKNSLKFLNNYPIDYIEGYLQLKYINNFCIITKATKEIMFLREHFDWDSVAGKSENTMIRRHMMNKLKSRFKYVLIWLDNDPAGERAQAKYIEEYPFLLPVTFNHLEKDPTDAYSFSTDREGELESINKLIQETIHGIR